MDTLTIDVKPPFHFKQMAARLLKYEKSTYAERNGALVRTVRVHGMPVLIGMTYDELKHQLQVTLSETCSSERQRELERLVRHMFSVDVDLSDFYRHVAKDSYLAPITKQFAGTRLVREPDLFESFVKTIIGQQLNMAFAGALTKRFVALSGDRLNIDGETWFVFPTPEQVADLDYEQLQALQFSRRKAEYIIDLARLVVNGGLDLNRLWNMSDEEVMQQLIRIRGVGKWTVECLMLFGMGRPNLLPAADIGLRNAVQKVYGLKTQPTEAEVREIGAAWSPWCSYATFYLWEYLG